MKKFLIIFGSFILFLISFGTMFKLMHWPGAGPLLVMGMTLFSFFFLPCFFIHRMVTGGKGLNITTNIFALISTFLMFTGVMFKIMHWPGAGPMIVFGTTLFVFPTLILYAVWQFKNEKKFGEFWRVVTMGVLTCVFLTFWGTNITRNILFADLKMEDAMLESNRDLREHNEMLAAEIKADSTIDLSKQVNKIHLLSEELNTFINEIKKELVTRVDENPEAIDNHWLMGSLDNYDIPTYILCSPNGRGARLSENLHLYRKQLEDELNSLPFENKKVLISDLGDFGIKTELNQELMYNFNTWEEGMFYNQTISSSLGLLTGIQTEVLNSEFRCLKMIRQNMKKK